MERGGFHGYRKNLIPNNNTSSGGNNNNTPSSNVVAPASNNGGGEETECTVREQDRFMPIANVIRIMRKILPPHAKISDDAKETIQECVSEYISFITGEANERCQREQRKTITAEDVLWAMSKLGFDDYIEPLTLFLHRYREAEGERTGAAAGSSSSSSAATGSSVPGALFKRGAAAAPPLDYGPFAAYYANSNGFFGGYGPGPSGGGAPQAHHGLNGGDQHSQFK